MEKNAKEHTTKHRSFLEFLMKVVLLALCVVVVVQFVVGAKSFASVKDRLKSVEGNIMGLTSMTMRNDEPKSRTKRSIDETEFKKALLKIQELEERLNKSYQYVGRQPVYLVRGPPGKDGPKGNDGKDGRDGAQGARGYRGVPGQRGPQGAKGRQGESAKVGVSYIRWGKKTCPYNTGATLVYEGYVGGSYYSQKGGASNYVCLTRDPIYQNYDSGFQEVRSRIFGGEYQTYADGIYPSSIHDHDAPCAVCLVTKRATQMMIPGRNVCPVGWKREYKGYLMAERYNHHRTTYTCVDESPDYTPGSHASANGALFYFVEGQCGSLPCKPYIGGRELTCAVCTR